jgi:hypothetical protein
MPKVINITSGEPFDCYVGRPSKFGNPFTHLQHLGGNLIIVDTREEAIARYEEWIRSQPELMEAAKKELKGKVLACHCVPLACHAEVLLKIANEE